MKKLLFWILLFESIICGAQPFCHTPQATDESNWSLMLRTRNGINNTTNSMYRLRVYVHVIRQPGGIGGHSYQTVQNVINVLNSDFNPHNIWFVWNDTIDYIDDINYYCFYDPFNSGYTPSIFSIHNHVDGIDLYLFPDEANFAGGKANGVGIGSELLIGGMYNNQTQSLVTSHIISHEMGHILFLWHTHHGTYYEGNEDPLQCAEYVDGSNSAVCGDYIEDTPADPNLDYQVNPSTYQWLGSGYDINGDPYNPDTRQIMSYTNVDCMSHFSLGQGERMRTAIESFEYLQSTLMPFIVGSNFPCENELYKVESLPNGCSIIWSWENGSSVPIVQNSPSVNQCTITNNNHAYINDVLVATIYKNNDVIHTVKKVLYTGTNFSGTYKQAPHNYGNWNYQGQASTPFYDGDNLYVINGTTITLKSNKFLGANITHSGDNPLSWTRSGDSITFHFRYIQPNNPNLKSITSLDFRQMTIDVVDTMTCEHSRFKIIGQPPLIPLASSQYVQMNMQDQHLIFTRNRGNGESDLFSAMKEVDSWMLTITNIATGQIMYLKRTDVNKLEVDISDWPASFYVATIQIGSYSTSIKFKL